MFTPTAATPLPALRVMPVVRCKHRRGKVDRVTVNFEEDRLSDVLERLHKALGLECGVDAMLACVNNDKLQEGPRAAVNAEEDISTPQDATLESLGLRVSTGARDTVLVGQAEAFRESVPCQVAGSHLPAVASTGTTAIFASQSTDDTSSNLIGPDSRGVASPMAATGASGARVARRVAVRKQHSPPPRRPLPVLAPLQPCLPTFPFCQQQTCIPVVHFRPRPPPGALLSLPAGQSELCLPRRKCFRPA